MKKHIALQLVLLCCVCLSAAVTFTKSPVLKDSAGKHWVEFALSGNADITVSIMDMRDSTVVRHLAAGVLGPKPPAPLLPNTLHQLFEWDGKDDLGFAVPNPASMSVRVRAGMSVALDKLIGDNLYSIGGAFGMAQGTDGSVFICGNPSPAVEQRHEMWPYKAIRQYDKTGNYVRTVYPIPAGMDTNKVSGWGLRYLPDNSYTVENATTSFPSFSKTYLAAYRDGGLNLQDLDAKGNLLLAAPRQVLSLGTDASISKTPQTGLLCTSPALPGAFLGTTFLTLLPGKTHALLSGFFHAAITSGHLNQAPDTNFYRDGRVFKVNLTTGAATAWLSLDSVPKLKADRQGPLNGGEFFASIHGTAVDAQGRIYVCDRLHRRIGVYDSNAVLIGQIPLAGPDFVAVSGKTGAIYAVQRTQSATGSLTGTLKLFKFSSFDQGAARVCSLSVSTTVSNKALRSSLIVSDSNAQTWIWLGYTSVGVKIYRDNGTQLALEKDFNAIAASTVQGYARLAIDRRSETVYISNGWWDIYKIENWGNPQVLTCSTSAKKALTGMDMAVSPHGMLYVRAGASPTPFGFIARYSLDHHHAPMNWTNTGANVLTPWVYGRWGGGHGEKGFAVNPDNQVASLWVSDDAGSLHWYEDSGSATDSSGKIKFRTSMQQAGGVKFDLKGNLYVGAKTASNHVVPAGFVGDWAYGNAVGTIVRFPAGFDTGAILAASTSGTDKIYSMGTAPYTKDRGKGGCICRSPRFDVDPYGRLFVPNAITCQVSISDNEDNEIIRFGGYGNSDSRGGLPGLPGQAVVATPAIPFLWPTSAVAGEDYIYVADHANFRLARIRMNYGLDNLPGITTAAIQKSPMKPRDFEMNCRPNPFNPVSQITVRLSAESRIRLEVFDATGRFINTIASDRYPSGRHAFNWNARDRHDRAVAAGTYYYRLAVGNKELYQKVALVK